MKLTLAAGKLSTSVGVVESKEPAVCGDLTPPTQPASENKQPRCPQNGGQQNMPSRFKTVFFFFLNKFNSMLCKKYT